MKQKPAKHRTKNRPPPGAGAEHAPPSFDIETKELRQAIFLDPPLLWPTGDDEPDLDQVFGVDKALDIAQAAAAEGRVFEAQRLAPKEDGHRAMEYCEKWRTGERELPFGMFAVLARVHAGQASGPRSYLIGVDSNADGEGFRFTTVKAFRDPGGRIGWVSSLFGMVSRDGARMRIQPWGGTDTGYETSHMGLLFHALALAADGDISAQTIIARSKLH